MGIEMEGMLDTYLHYKGGKSTFKGAAAKANTKWYLPISLKYLLDSFALSTDCPSIAKTRDILLFQNPNTASRSARILSPGLKISILVVHLFPFTAGHEKSTLTCCG